jgi:uncharacterized integral membrane protein (TIGR00698 family)
MSKSDETDGAPWNSRVGNASFDSMEGVPTFAPAEADLPLGRRIVAAARRIWPGLSIAVLVALAASWLADHYAAPVMLFALLLGMALNFLSQHGRCRAGVDFATRNVLRAGVALLGARITLDQVQSLGLGTLALATSAVILTILAGWLIARLLKLKAEFGILTGGSVAICGASAALALSSVLPPSPTRERDAVLTVVGVTTLSTVAMVIYPVLATAFGLSDAQAGIFLGATIHDVAQVVGAGYGVSEPAGDTATIVKLFRVALLLPAALVIALIFRNQAAPKSQGRRPPLIPMFLLAFVALVALNSTLAVPPVVVAAAGEASRWCLITAIAGLGVKTSLGDFVHVGWRPAALILAETVFVLVLVLGLILLGLAG